MAASSGSDGLAFYSFINLANLPSEWGTGEKLHQVHDIATDTRITKGLGFATGASAVLCLLKLVLYFISGGSLIVLASFFDSAVDTAVSAMNRKISVIARTRADVSHPFGHGGYEVVGAVIQGALIVFLAAMLFRESFSGLFTQAQRDLSLDHMLFSAGMLVIGALGGALIHARLDRVYSDVKGDQGRSLAVESDMAHYAGDVGLNLIGALGLVAVWYTEWVFIDDALGFVAGFWLLKTAYPLLRNSFEDIVHKEVSIEMQQRLADLIVSSSPEVVGFHQLRTRQLGPDVFIDFHLKLADHLSLKKAHDIGDSVVANIKSEYPNADVIVHLDPESERDQVPWKPRYELNDEGLKGK